VGGVGDGPGLADLHAPVPPVHRPVVVVRDAGEPHRPGVGDERLRVGEQALLVALERAHIVPAPVDDGPGDGGVAAHRVDGHDAAFQRQQPKHLRQRAQLARLVRHRPLREHQPRPGRPRAHQAQRRLARAPVVRPPRLLAIDGDHLRLNPRRRMHARDPAPETRRDAVGVQRREHAPERVVRGDALRQLQERGQPRPLGLAELLHLDPPVGPTDRRTQRDREDRDQGMVLRAFHARVVQGREVCRDTHILPLPHTHGQRQPPPPCDGETNRSITLARARGKPGYLDAIALRYVDI